MIRIIKIYIQYDVELQQKINGFMKEEQDLVTMEEMQNYYDSVDKSKIGQVYERLYKFTRDNRENESISKEVGEDDNYQR